ncbi:hypothetical protein BB347_05595 [Natronorubrum daqingense]|nr:hypothetical protein BB347_05595 [Natronorubrum daqingense]
MAMGVSGCLSDLAVNVPPSNDNSATNEEVPDEKSEQGHADPLTASAEVSTDDVRDGLDNETICQSEASEAAFHVIQSELGDSFDEAESDDSWQSITPSVSSSDGVSIRMTTVLSRNGDVRRTPKSDFEEVVEVTPETVDITVDIDGETYQCTDDVTVVQEAEQED